MECQMTLLQVGIHTEWSGSNLAQLTGVGPATWWVRLGLWPEGACTLWREGTLGTWWSCLWQNLAGGPLEACTPFCQQELISKVKGLCVIVLSLSPSHSVLQFYSLTKYPWSLCSIPVKKWNVPRVQRQSFQAWSLCSRGPQMGIVVEIKQ